MGHPVDWEENHTEKRRRRVLDPTGNTDAVTSGLGSDTLSENKVIKGIFGTRE